MTERRIAAAAVIADLDLDVLAVAGLGAAQHQTRAGVVGNDGGADARFLAGLIDGVTHAGQRVVAGVDGDRRQLGVADGDVQRTAVELGIGRVGDGLEGNLAAGGKAVDLDLVGASHRALGGARLENVFVGRLGGARHEHSIAVQRRERRLERADRTLELAQGSETSSGGLLQGGELVGLSRALQVHHLVHQIGVIGRAYSYRDTGHNPSPSKNRACTALSLR